jgi:hypothetical protein
MGTLQSFQVVAQQRGFTDSKQRFPRVPQTAPFGGRSFPLQRFQTPFERTFTFSKTVEVFCLKAGN